MLKVSVSPAEIAISRCEGFRTLVEQFPDAKERLDQKIQEVVAESTVTLDQLINLIDRHWRDVEDDLHFEFMLEATGKVLSASPEWEEKDGYFVREIYPSYDDRLANETIKRILYSEDPEGTLFDLLISGYEFDEAESVSSAFRLVEEAITKEGMPFSEGLNSHQVYLLEEAIRERAYIEYPMQHFLDQEILADIAVDTGDGNYDFALNTPATINEESSLVWLAATQGYTMAQLMAALQTEEVDRLPKFLKSVRQEVDNEVSDLNTLIFLVRTTLADLIKVREVANGTICLSKEATVGLYNAWSGGGSLFEIELERDVHLPIKYLDKFVPDFMLGRWGVECCYGMCHSAWKDVAKFKGGKKDE